MRRTLKCFGKAVGYIGFILIVLVNGLHAQETVPATGGNASGSDGTVNYTVGQAIYTTISGTAGTVSQGIQQAYEISVIFTTPEAATITLEGTVYPNPVTDVFTLHILNYEMFQDKTITYSFYSMDNKLILTNLVESDRTQISIGELQPAIYYLLLMDTSGGSAPKLMKSFKIMKN